MKKTVLFLSLIVIAGLTASRAKAADLGNGFSLSNVTYLDYSYATGDHFDSNNTNFGGQTAETDKGYADGFHFSRVYFTLKKQINDDFMVRLTTDQMTVRPDGNSEATPWGLSGFAGTGRGNLFIKYIYGEYILNPSLKVRFGLTQTPWIDEAENRWTMRFLRPTYWDEQGVLTSSDLGVAVLGSFFDKMITYHLMFSNGEGYENNNVNGQGNSGQLRVDLNLAGFTFSVFGLTENATGEYKSSTSTPIPNSGFNEDREIFYLMYTDPMFRVSAEYMMANDSVDNTSYNSTAGSALPGTTFTSLSTSTGAPRFSLGRGYGAWAWTKIPNLEAMRIFGRFYTITPNSANDDGKMTEYNIGLSYDLNENLTVAIDDTMIDQKLAVTGNTSTLNDFKDNVYAVRALVTF
jgi:hypothetical protein